MQKLKLVVADADHFYLESLCEYINEAYQGEIRVISFNRIDFLNNYLLGGEKVDILLAGPEFVCEQLKSAQISITVILSEGEGENTGDYFVSKYQPGDKLVGQLIDFYWERNSKIIKEKDISGHTKVVSVFSPCGGAGKSTVAACMAIQSSLMGLKAFYLNMETFSSSQFLLNGQGPKCLSNVLLYLRDSEAALPVKIGTAIVSDIKYNLDFFLPPESGAELSDLDAKATSNLLSGMRRVGDYDLIVVDLESSLNERNLAVLENSEKIVLIMTQDYSCSHKTGLMFEEFRKVGLDIKNNIIPVINKHRPRYPIDCEYPAQFVVPQVEDIIAKNGLPGFFEFNKQYADYIFKLTKAVTS
ncbi:MAG: P-loop NTPase family protein [Desulfocucumaceae bacterium]